MPFCTAYFEFHQGSLRDLLKYVFSLEAAYLLRNSLEQRNRGAGSIEFLIVCWTAPVLFELLGNCSHARLPEDTVFQHRRAGSGFGQRNVFNALGLSRILF